MECGCGEGRRFVVVEEATAAKSTPKKSKRLLFALKIFKSPDPLSQRDKHGFFSSCGGSGYHTKKIDFSAGVKRRRRVCGCGGGGL